jgi:hypothetical protein
MKSTFFFISFFIFTAISSDISACSVFTNAPAKFHRSLFGNSKVLPTSPTVTISSIIRAGDMGASCNDIAILVLAIPIETPNPSYAYKFELVSGTEPASLFKKEPIIGAIQDGKQTFAFSWIEGRALPFDLVVRVTAYTKSGKRGGFTNISLSYAGR